MLIPAVSTEEKQRTEKYRRPAYPLKSSVGVILNSSPPFSVRSLSFRPMSIDRRYINPTICGIGYLSIVANRCSISSYGLYNMFTLLDPTS